MTSMAIRIMPSTAHRSEDQAAQRDDLTPLSAGTDVYKDDSLKTVKRRENVQQRSCRRCITSAMSATLLSVAILTGAAISAAWVPSSMLAEEELEISSINQLNSAADQVSKEVLAYLQAASSQAGVVSLLYGMSFETWTSSANNSLTTAATEQFLDKFGEGVWSLLRQSPSLSSVLVAQARDPALVNESADPACDTDVALLSGSYKANLNHKTTGVATDRSVDELKSDATDLAPPGKARMNNIVGNENLSNPLGFDSFKSFLDCSRWLGNGENLWPMQNLPGPQDVVHP